MEHGASKRSEELHSRGLGECARLSFGPGREQSRERSEPIDQDVAPRLRRAFADGAKQIG